MIVYVGADNEVGLRWQPSPVTLQRCHAYRKLDGVGLQVPFEAVSVAPTLTAPEIVGPVEVGGATGGGGGIGVGDGVAAVTSAVGALLTDLVQSPFGATWTTIA